MVKLLGKSIGFRIMKERLTRIWKLFVGFNIMDIGNGYFMINFDMGVDCVKVIEEDLILTWTSLGLLTYVHSRSYGPLLRNLVPI